MDILKVVCGIIYFNNKVFLCRINPEKSLGGYWEFPGGKIEQGESYEASLSRELVEELGMRVEVKKYFYTNVHYYENFTIELISYTCNFVDADFQLTDHDAYEWVNISDLMKWDLAPADMPIARKLCTVKGSLSP